jgi:hypothetical protein
MNLLCIRGIFLLHPDKVHLQSAGFIPNPVYPLPVPSPHKGRNSRPHRSTDTGILFARLWRPTLALLSLASLTGCRYLHADPQTAFLGDSITAGWSYPSVNYGIRGNTTAEILARFPSAIPNHGYHTVVILGGTNDVLQKLDPSITIHNLETLAEDTVQNHAEPILCEIPPIFHSYDPADHTDYMPAVIVLNQRIVTLASAHRWKLVDYYDSLAAHPTYLSDGVHMKTRGYLVMEHALLPALPH